MTTKPAEPRWPVLLLVACFLGTLVQLVTLFTNSIPLGIPGEWVWQRFAQTDILISWSWPVLCGLGMVVFGYFGSHLIHGASRTFSITMLLALWMIGSVWILCLAAGTPGIGSLNRIPFVLFYPRCSGYFTQAAAHLHESREFVKTYHERISDPKNPENHLHLGTHPPGLTVSLMGLIRLMENSPAITKMVQATMPGQVRESNLAVEQLTAASGQENAYRVSDQAVIWVSALITVICASGTVVPLFLLCRRLVDQETAWWVCLFWLLVPAVTVFMPKSDMLFPFLTMWSQWLWLKALDSNSKLYGFLTSLVMLIAATLSLAFAPVGLILFLQGLILPALQNKRSGPHNNAIAEDPQLARHSLSLIPELRNSRVEIWPRIQVYFAGVVAVLLWLALWGVLGRLNILAVYIQNVRNHASFYTHHTRTYLAWLFENPIELAFSVGMPLAILGALGVWQLLRSRPQYWELVLIPAAVWTILWITGKNSGEAARLWIFLMPYICWLAAWPMSLLLKQNLGSRIVLLLFVLQIVCCVSTSMLIDGFGFLELEAA